MHTAQSMTIGMCTAGLPGIDNVNLASHTMREGKSRSWWSRCASKLKKPTQDALARTVTEGQQVQHGSACTDASGASGFTTVSGEVRGAAAGAGIGCSQSSCVFSHRPPASPRTVLRRPEQVCLRGPQVQFLGLAWTAAGGSKQKKPGSRFRVPSWGGYSRCAIGCHCWHRKQEPGRQNIG